MLEQEKKDTETSTKLLESQRNALLDSLERIQKILQGFESVIKDKNEKLQETSTKLEESEINLEEAMQKLATLKEASKDKKELQKQVKHLQASLRDYETRQFTNAKVIAYIHLEFMIFWLFFNLGMYLLISEFLIKQRLFLTKTIASRSQELLC